MRTSDTRTYFLQYLKRHSYRITHERMEVLDAVLQSSDHFDADELFLRLKTHGSKVSRATVYNTLERLTESGVVSRYRFGEKLARYELIHGTEPHQHFICRSCGKIEEFSDPRVLRLARDAAQTMNYHLEDIVFQLFGICPQCRRERDGDRPTL